MQNTTRTHRKKIILLSQLILPSLESSLTTYEHHTTLGMKQHLKEILNKKRNFLKNNVEKLLKKVAKKSGQYEVSKKLKKILKTSPRDPL